MSEITSRPNRPDPVHGCCEACVYGRGEHAEWCWGCPAGCGRRINLSGHMKLRHSQARCKCGCRFATSNLKICPNCGRECGDPRCFQPLPGGIPADCEYCLAGEFEAVGMLAGRAICAKCLTEQR